MSGREIKAQITRSRQTGISFLNMDIIRRIGALQSFIVYIVFQIMTKYLRIRDNKSQEFSIGKDSLVYFVQLVFIPEVVKDILIFFRKAVYIFSSAVICRELRAISVDLYENSGLEKNQQSIEHSFGML